MSGWIGVDLDGTLAEHATGAGIDGIGRPVPRMLARVKKWIEEGREVRVVTARVSPVGHDGEMVREQARMVAEWCERHIGRALPVTCSKDFGMVELWDDRAVGVEANSGRRTDGVEDGEGVESPVKAVSDALARAMEIATKTGIAAVGAYAIRGSGQKPGFEARILTNAGPGPLLAVAKGLDQIIRSRLPKAADTDGGRIVVPKGFKR